MKTSRGFTFIEIVAAIAILAIGILSILAIFPVGIDSSKKATTRTKAAMLGEMEIEGLKTTISFANLANISKRNFYDSAFDDPNNRIDPENQYQFRVDVSNVALKTDGTTDKLRKVVVTVYWPAKLDPLCNGTNQDKQQSMAFTTYVANR